MSSNRFHFIVPFYNAQSTITQSLLSVFSQSYRNWHITLIDDMSTDETQKNIDVLVKVFGAQDRVDVITNEEKKWEVRNIVEALDNCDDSDIVCRLDGDDWLCDLDALAIINHRYNQTGAKAIWTKHRWGFDDNLNISGPMPRNANPYEHRWVSSHLKTFRKYLLNGVSKDNYKNSNGEYFKRIGDQAMYLPALYRSGGDWHFEPIVAYHYTIDVKPETFQTDDAKFQKSEAEQLRARGFIR